MATDRQQVQMWVCDLVISRFSIMEWNVEWTIENGKLLAYEQSCLKKEISLRGKDFESV